MSNHFHICLTDEDSELSTFMEHLNGHLAKLINAIDRERGQVFERRFAAIEILDDEAMLDRVVYAITNPVAANLVRRHDDWPGLALWFGNVPGPVHVQRLRRNDLRRAQRIAQRLGLEVHEADFYDHAELLLHRDHALDPDRVRSAIRDREEHLARQRTGDVLGADRVLRADPFDRPDRPKRSPMPLCHTSDRATWDEFRRTWRAFVRAYHEASAAFRAGAFAVLFPENTFRPPLPLRIQAPPAAAAA